MFSREEQHTKDQGCRQEILCRSDGSYRPFLDFNFKFPTSYSCFRSHFPMFVQFDFKISAGKHANYVFLQMLDKRNLSCLLLKLNFKTYPHDTGILEPCFLLAIYGQSGRGPGGGVTLPLFWVLFGVAPGFLGTFLGYSRIFGYHFLAIPGLLGIIFLVKFDFFLNNPDFGVLILIFPSMTLWNVACRALVSMILQFPFLSYHACAKSSILSITAIS